MVFNLTLSTHQTKLPGFLRTSTALGNPEVVLEGLQELGSTQPLSHPGRLGLCWLSYRAPGQELQERVVPIALFLPPLTLGPKSEASENGEVGLGGCWSP